MFSTSPYNHTHGRWGSIGGCGVATDRYIRRGNRIPIPKGVNRWEVSTGQDRPVITSIGPPQHVCKERSLGDYCYVPSCLIRQDIDVTFDRLSVREMVLRPLFCL